MCTFCILPTTLVTFRKFELSQTKSSNRPIIPLTVEGGFQPGGVQYLPDFVKVLCVDVW